MFDGHDATFFGVDFQTPSINRNCLSCKSQVTFQLLVSKTRSSKYTRNIKEQLFLASSFLINPSRLISNRERDMGDPCGTRSVNHSVMLGGIQLGFSRIYFCLSIIQNCYSIHCVVCTSEVDEHQGLVVTAFNLLQPFHKDKYIDVCAHSPHKAVQGLRVTFQIYDQFSAKSQFSFWNFRSYPIQISYQLRMCVSFTVENPPVTSYDIMMGDPMIRNDFIISN